MSSPTPTCLKGDAEALHIEWSDGVKHRLTWRLLRDECPCATCKGHGDGPPPKPPTPPPGSLPVLSLAEAQPLRVAQMRPMGNYAYSIHFSDGHNTGIYTLVYLRELGEGSVEGPGSRV
jgi:DUF971 family protein